MNPPLSNEVWIWLYVIAEVNAIRDRVFSNGKILTNYAEHSEEGDEEALNQVGGCLPQVKDGVDQHVVVVNLFQMFIWKHHKIKALNKGRHR